MTTLLASKCRWCGNALSGKIGRARYCSDPCRANMHNLRMARGAQLHDELMAWAADYTQRHRLTDIGRMVRAWVAEDQRAGRGLPEALWKSPVNRKKVAA